ncbi:carboxypeptidase regulatory-like domain-containing protein [Undibacterium sp.]|uniref:carboxypeptidase regulatory-like domain-containing protein n=1 Tax=Undibacterium sp. TaxID=1914977 RepID=UPI002C3A644F|nr:carboxypeptidase regulatory-like domain-containing protein [Undibacterium sp.]HTD06276.1 carboxypeptidase regulatory-like domain-containing protein [Undibacterium sp.]
MKTVSMLALAGLISAQGAYVYANEVGAGLPAVTHKGDVSFLSGGIGLEESTAMQHAARNYPLEMEFLDKASPRDEYTANVHVKVENAQHAVVLDTVAQGPFLLAKLPDGHYRVQAEQGGISKQRDVTLTGKGPQQKLIFVWPS